MAEGVNIPIYVDIQGAFDRAVREIPKETQKLEKVLSRHALNMKIDYGFGQYKTVRNLLTDTTMDAQELEFALKRVRKAYDEAVVKGANKTKTSATVNNLAKAYGLLEQRVKGFYNSNNVAAMRLEDDIAKVSYKINDMKTKLSGLSVGSDQYNKINYELQIQRQRLAELTAQQMKYKAGIDASTSAYHKQAGIVKQLTGYFSGLYAVHSLVRFVKQVRDVTGELEYQRVALGHLLQDEEFGNELFAKTIEAAKESPFRIGQLVTYTKQLAAYRIEQENLFDTTQRLADISAGLGVDMNRLILAFGQVRAASVLRGQELRQFTEAGIPLVELLAEKFRQLGREGTTTADVFKLISERAVPFEYIKEIFEDLTNAGGQFYKMQETQAKTLQGRWEKLKDAYDQALMRFGNTQTFQSMNDIVLSILNGIAKNLNNVVRIVNAGSIAWAAYWLATKSGLSYGARLASMFIKEYGVVKTLTFGVGGLTAAFKKLWAAMKTNWVGLAFAAVGGLVTWFTTFKNKTKEATKDLSDMQKAIEQMKDANKEFEYGKGLVASYEELAKKTDRTSRESERLLDTLNELERTFPGLTDKINNDNLTLEERIGIMREAVNASHDLAVEEAKNRLNTQNEIIRGLEDQEKAARLVKESAQRRLEAAQTAEKVGPVPIEQRYGPGTYDTAKDLKNKTIEAAKAAKEADDAYEDIATSLATARREAEQLRKLAFPEEQTGGMDEWQRQVKQIQDDKKEIGSSPVFTDAEIKDLKSVYDLYGKLKKRSKDLSESIDGMREALSKMTKGTDAYVEMENDIADAEHTKAVADAIKAFFGFDFSERTSYDKDPFIGYMQDRIKFMKDFKKGYDDLNKYMSSNDALAKQAAIMRNRGLSLGIDPAEQARAAENLSKWYEQEMDRVFEQAEKYGARGGIKAFLSQVINDTSNSGKALKDFQNLLQSIFDAKTDLDTSELEKTLENEIEALADEVKRSEVARNFYQDIFSLTGDEDLATNMAISVYGDIGSEFKENIQKQLEAAFKKFDAKGNSLLLNKVKKAVEEKDFGTIMQYLDKFPKEWRKRLKEMADADQKFNADAAKNLLTSLKRAKTYSEKRVELANQTARRLSEIEAMNVSDSVKAQLRKQNAKKEADEEAKLMYDAFKDTPMYVEVFANLDEASSRMLRSMRENLSAMKDQWKDNLPPTELKELQSRLNELDKQLASRNPFKALISSIKAYRKLTKQKSRKEADLEAESATKNAEQQKERLSTAIQEYETAKKKYGVYSDEAAIAEEALNDQKEATDESIKQADAAQKTANKYREVGQSIRHAADELKKWSGYINTSLDGIGQIFKTFSSSDAGETFDILSEGVGKTLSGTADLAAGVGKIISGTDIVGGIVDVVKGAGDFIEGTFGTSNRLKIKRINEQIEEQARLIKELEYSYNRLENALSKSFGSDYIANYNQQISTLQAQAEAYRNQAELEKDKGKKSDEDKVREYLNSAREVEAQIKDMENQLSEFFTETNLTSAAKDFAQSWIEAYKEFGSTTDAIKQKFNDMIENMVVNSLAAQLIQSILRPVFEAIDTASKDGALSAAEIAAVSAMVPERMQMIDDSMQSLMNQLTSAGVNLRQQVGGFTGISRDIAGATEESINGLAAGINTQNFYMQHIDANVAAILATLTGGTTTAASGTTGEYVDPYKDTMLLYAQHIPDIHETLNSILSSLNSVIALNGTKKAIQVMM